MTVWIVIGCILLALFLLGLVRVGGGGEYSAEGLRAWLQVGPIRIGLLPAKDKPKKKKKAKKKPKKETPGKGPEKEGKPGGPVEQVKRYLPLICEAAGEAKRRIRIDRLLVDYTLPGKEDAAAAAMHFGYSSAAVGFVLSLIEQNFDVAERRVRTAVDFNADSPKIYLYGAISGRLGWLCCFALRLGWKFLMLTKNQKKEAS